jgi:hypothetical protein
MHKLYNTISILSFIICILFTACKKETNYQQLDAFSQSQLHTWNKKLTDVIVKDIFTPPVASRIYVYPNIAAYEVLKLEHRDYESLAGQVKGLSAIPAPERGKKYYLPLASMIAFSTVSQKLVFAGEDLQKHEQDYIRQITDIGIAEDVLHNSVAYGRQVGKHILSWVSHDGYLERTALPRYLLMSEPGKWQPTAPGYMPAIEPYWNKMRPLLLDSCSQFQPPLPTVYDTLPSSHFYKESYEVYQTSKNLTSEQLAIAKFWDCNPNQSYTKGHVTFFHQKISPGGHWMGIASIVSKQKALNLIQTSEVFTTTAIALYDGFISCWDEKYRSNHIRPETYIEKYIDPQWDPILQTPPFPEYTSGHSVISNAAAAMLTSLLGDNIAFTDSTEVEYGLPARNFSSFNHAAGEAAISRLYGGIHFRPAIENGSRQGRKLGEYVASRLRTRVKEQKPPAEIANNQ